MQSARRQKSERDLVGEKITVFSVRQWLLPGPLEKLYHGLGPIMKQMAEV